jgi:hypothetical protein
MLRDEPLGKLEIVVGREQAAQGHG